MKVFLFIDNVIIYNKNFKEFVDIIIGFIKGE